MRQIATALFCMALAACSVSAPQPSRTSQPAPPVDQADIPRQSTGMSIVRSRANGVAAYQRVTRRIEPVAEKICRQFSQDLPPKFCDFLVRVDENTKSPPNAFQTIGRDGRPIITFNVNMLRSVRNDDEIAFIMGHEAGHQIARHLLQKRSNANAGAIIGALVVGSLGGNPMDGANLGGAIGGRSFSKQFELEADRIGAHIAVRAGYNAILGAKSFARTGGSNSLLSTHPPGIDRFNVVRQTVAEIQAARQQNQTAPIRW